MFRFRVTMVARDAHRSGVSVESPVLKLRALAAGWCVVGIALVAGFSLLGYGIRESRQFVAWQLLDEGEQASTSPIG